MSQVSHFNNVHSFYQNKEIYFSPYKLFTKIQDKYFLSYFLLGIIHEKEEIYGRNRKNLVSPGNSLNC